MGQRHSSSSSHTWEDIRLGSFVVLVVILCNLIILNLHLLAKAAGSFIYFLVIKQWKRREEIIMFKNILKMRNISIRLGRFSIDNPLTTSPGLLWFNEQMFNYFLHFGYCILFFCWAQLFKNIVFGLRLTHKHSHKK
jgi:hypothetical protein